jgi:hypothetical protein
VCVHVCCRYAGGRSMDFLNKIGQQAEGIAGNVWNHCKSVYQEYSWHILYAVFSLYCDVSSYFQLQACTSVQVRFIQLATSSCCVIYAGLHHENDVERERERKRSLFGYNFFLQWIYF